MSLFLWVLLGLCFGSFANVCIHRLPGGGSVVRPPSACPRCGRRLPWHENVPLLSYARLRGRCAGCRAPISARYPLVETLTAALFAAVHLVHAPSVPDLLAGGFLSALLVVITFIDYDHRIIPDETSGALLAGALLFLPWNAALGDGFAARAAGGALGAAAGAALAIAVAVFGKLVWKKDALGGGDVKLLAALGAWVGWRGAVFTLFAGSVLGTAAALVLLLAGRLRRGEYLPFGPFLAAAAWIRWLGWPPIRLPF